MLTFNNESALKIAIEIAKTICQNPSNKFYPEEENAKTMATFIKKLATELTTNGEQ